MKIGILERTMWKVFRPTFQKNTSIIGVEDSKMLMKKAKIKYYEILKDIPEYGENDVLLINLIGAAMYASVYISLEKKPTIDRLSEYYEIAMNSNIVMKIFLKSSNYYSKKYQNSLKKSAEKSQKSSNPYTWRFKVIQGDTLESFDAVFDRCGIWHMMNQLGIPEATPALCRYDYAMAKLTNTVFTREQTLAGGGTMCDCHYRKKK